MSASFDIIAQRLIGHFLPFFLDPNGPALTLADNFHEVELRAFFRDNFQAFANVRNFAVGGRTFTLSGFRLQSAIADHHELVYAAQYREVITERLARFLPNLKNKLNDPERGSFAYLAFIQSPFLDERVNSESSDFSIRKEPTARDLGEAPNREASAASGDLFADEISLNAIRDAALAAVTEDLQVYLDEINSSKEAALTSYVAEEAPQYHVLMKYKDEFIDQIPPDATKNELDMALHRQLHQRQVQLRQESAQILAEAENVQDPQEYYARFRDFMERFNEIGKSALAQYVVHRRVILELLEKALPESSDG